MSEHPDTAGVVDPEEFRPDAPPAPQHAVPAGRYTGAMPPAHPSVLDPGLPADPDPADSYAGSYAEPAVGGATYADDAAATQVPPRPQTLAAHLAGIEDGASGAAVLWLSDEVTTMEFPLTAATTPALLEQLRELTARPADVRRPTVLPPDDGFEDEPEPLAPAEQPEPEERPENTSRLARWTGWHYSNNVVSRIPPRQRIALFAAIVVILLLITIFNH